MSCRIERWAVSKTELTNLDKLNGNDELLAYIPDELGVVIYRNGRVSNRWEDGVVGVNQEMKDKVDEIDTLYHPNHSEDTELWIDVMVDEVGNFVSRIVKETHN